MNTTFYKAEPPWETLAKAREYERQECLKIIYAYIGEGIPGLSGLEAAREIAARIRARDAISESNGIREGK